MRTMQLGLDAVTETSREAQDILVRLVKDYSRAEM